MKALSKAFREVSLKDALAEVLIDRANYLVNGPIYDPGMLEIRPSKITGDEELWLGQSTLLVAGGEIERVKVKLSKVMVNMVYWEEVEELKRLYRRMSDLLDKIAEEVEILRLRKVFPGKCRLCPV